MEDKKVYIKKIVSEFIEKEKLDLDKILLFGSRARGDYSVESDWDILIVVNENLTIENKRRLAKNLRTIFAKNLIPADIIIKNRSEIPYFEKFIGSVTKEALKEGIIL